MAKGVDIPLQRGRAAFLSAKRAMPRKDLAAAFNARFGRSVSAANIAAVCKRNGWTTGRSGRFEKGIVPANKGTKGLMKANAGSFRRGLVPHNAVPVGTEAVAKGWVKVKVAEPDVWRNKSELVWEAAGRKLEKGFLLIHLDGDFANMLWKPVSGAPRRFAKTEPSGVFECAAGGAHEHGGRRAAGYGNKGGGRGRLKKQREQKHEI